MRSLFTYVEATNSVEIDPTAYTLLPYRKLWDRDKSKGKNKAREELAYVYFMADFKSFFSNITDQVEKHKEVSKVVFSKEDYKIDDAVKDAITFYKQDIPISVSLLEDAKIGIDSLRKYFREVNLLETTEKGALLHDSAKLTNNIQKLSQIVESLDSLEQKVKRDIESNNTVRGGKEKGMFED